MEKNNIVFLVDDDKVYLELLKNYLQKYSFIIESYTNGKDCIDNLYKNPEIIILDFTFDNATGELSNGRQIFLEIKKRKSTAHIILLSNQESGQIVFELMHSGMKDYLKKDENVFKNLDELLKPYLPSE